MRPFLIIISILFVFSDFVKAQQDNMFTQYMFNSLVYNPAYAGSRDYLSVGLIHRSQWLGFEEGAPVTQAFTIHSPLRNKNIGIGFSAFNDKIGPSNQLAFQGSYAYRFPIGAFGHLALGVQGSVMNWRSDFSNLKQKDPNDPAFVGDLTPNYWLPNFGAGLYLSTPTFFLGASVPHLLDNDLRRTSIANDTIKYARLYRHYYVTGGIAIKFSNSVVFRPSILIRNVGLFGEFKESGTGTSAPTVFDIDAAFRFNEAVWVGVALRSAFQGANGQSSYDSVDFWTQVHLKNGLRIGFAYDFTLSRVKEASAGSIEAMLGYEFNYEKDKIVSPRYF